MKEKNGENRMGWMDGMGWDGILDGIGWMGMSRFSSLRSLKRRDYQLGMESRYYKYYWTSSHLTGRGRAPPPVS